MPDKYRLLRRDRAAVPIPDEIEHVYKCLKYDYGSASADTRMKNLLHVSVTYRPDGDYPFFTIPREDLEPA